MKKILLTALFVLPLFSFAQSIPSFPMAFYGVATINGNTAPTGTIIRAYYGTTLAGQSVTDSSGNYGYASSTAQKLHIGEGVGPITFTFQSPSILSGQESLGSTTISVAGFQEGVSQLNNLNFTYSIPVAVAVPPSTGGGGGGGSSGGGSSSGGGGGGSIVPIVTPILTATSGPVTSSIFTSSSTPLLITPLAFGVTDSEIIVLQRFLNSQGYTVSTSGSGSSGNESNYFGTKTKNALIKFQKAQGLTANLGNLDTQTINKINSIYSQSNNSTTITDAQKQALITSLRAQLASLMAQLIALLQARISK